MSLQYAILLAIIFILEIAAGAVAYAYKGKVSWNSTKTLGIRLNIVYSGYKADNDINLKWLSTFFLAF